MLSAKQKMLELRANRKGHHQSAQTPESETSCYSEAFEQTVVRGSSLVKDVSARFHEFLDQNDFLAITKPNWLRFLSRSRNILHNEVSRFEIGRSRVAEYRYALSALEEGGQQDADMALELRLRHAALDAYSASLDRMEPTQADLVDEFVGLKKDELGNASRATLAAYPNDVLFSMDAVGLQWSFGALDVLHRRTRHFLASCGPGKDLAQAYRWQPGDQRQLQQWGTADPGEFYRVLAELRTASAARAQLEETALLASKSASRPNAAALAASFPSLAADDYYHRAYSSGSRPRSRLDDGPQPREGDCRWSSGLAQSAVGDLLAAEALAPTFAAFPVLPAPAIIRVYPDEPLGRGARLRTCATPPQLLAWGFSRDPAAGVAAVSLADALAEAAERLDALHALQAPADLRAQRQSDLAQARMQQQRVEGWGRLAAAVVGCPGDVWDAPPNDFWHPLAADAAAAEWERFHAATVAAAAALPGAGRPSAAEKKGGEVPREAVGKD
jgi:hypothetical protein